MKYDGEFNISDIFTNDKYKARALLLFFTIIIAILIILVRTSKPVNNSINKNESNQNSNTPIDNNINDPVTNPEENDSNSLYSRFSFLKLNNYEFDFDIDTNKKINIKGTRYDNKFKMIVKDDVESYEYQMRNKIAKATINGELTTVNMPIVLIDYFDNNVLYTILYYSSIVEESDELIEYEIDNEKLSKLLSQQVSLTINEDNKQMKNKINVYLNNNKINHIYLDLNNFISNVNEINKLTIDLKYDKVGQIDDFKLDF